MKKFKLVFWSDCRGIEIDWVLEGEFESGKELLEFLIEDKIKEEGEDWIESVNSVIGSDGEWVENREDWDMFVIGDLDNKVFEIDFSNELDSCLVVREDCEYFNRDFDLDLLEEVEEKYIW